MPNSVESQPWGPTWALGNVPVATPGTPVRIMKNVDANNVNAPETPSNSITSEYTPLVSQLAFQGMKQGANNSGMQPNQGNLYLIAWNGNTGGGGNLADPGAILLTIPPGPNTVFWPPAGVLGGFFSPYAYGLDADNANDAATITAFRIG